MLHHAMTCANIINIVGLLANLVGVILLFRYGMPFRIRTGGSSVYVSSSVDPKEVRAEGWAEVLGWIGLIVIVLGTAAQVGAVFL
jgi:hypothetical protein